MAVVSGNSRAIEASVSADLAVHTALSGSEGPYLKRVPHGGSLPELQRKKINLYVADPLQSPVAGILADLIRRACLLRQAPEPVRVAGSRA
jgi:hypothetical protein